MQEYDDPQAKTRERANHPRNVRTGEPNAGVRLMAALSFVAAEDGLEEDPKLKTLARLLKVARPWPFGS